MLSSLCIEVLVLIVWHSIKLYCFVGQRKSSIVFQMSTSFKMFLDNWNIQTALWLKRYVSSRTFLDVFWHLVLEVELHRIHVLN